MVMRAVMSSKGQIVVPAAFRKRYGLQGGTTIVFEEDKGRIVLKPSNFSALLALRGTLDAPLEQTLVDERARELQREEDR